MQGLLAAFLLAGSSCHAQLRSDVRESYLSEAIALGPENFLEQKTKSRSLTSYEYAQLMQNHVLEARPDAGTFGLGFVYVGDGEWRLCDRAPEPSSFTLLLASAALWMVRGRGLTFLRKNGERSYE